MSTAGSAERLAAEASGPEPPEAAEPLAVAGRFVRLRRWGAVLSGIGAMAGVLGAIAVVFVALHVSALQGIAAAEAAVAAHRTATHRTAAQRTALASRGSQVTIPGNSAMTTTMTIWMAMNGTTPR